MNVVFGGVNTAPLFCTLRLKGLNPALQYQVDGTDSLYSGKALMNAGYPFPQVQGDYPAFQIYLRAVE